MTEEEKRLLESWQKEAACHQGLVDLASELLERVEQWANGSTTFPGLLLQDIRLWLGPHRCGACKTGGCPVHSSSAMCSQPDCARVPIDGSDFCEEHQD